jgi:hypothetical protein
MGRCGWTRGWLDAGAVGVSAVLMGACSTSGATGGDGGGGGHAGAPGAGGSAGVVVHGDAGLALCGPAACAAPGDGNAALAADDFTGALAAYRCGSTPEALFGAGLTTLITAIEGDSSKLVLSDLGFAPLSAKDLVGKAGLFARHASRWQGQGSVQIASDGGPINLTASFDRGRQRMAALGIAVNMQDSSPSGYSFSLSTYDQPLTALTVGQRIYFGCPTGGASGVGIPPYVYLSNADINCSNTMAGTACSQTSGSILITKAGTAVGDAVAYTLENVLLQCTLRGATSVTSVRLQGSVTTSIVPASVDTSGLHPLLQDQRIDSAPAGVTLEQVAGHAAGLEASLELAACYMNAAAAAASTDKVFEIPSSVFGGKAVPITRGDAMMLAATSQLAAAWLSIAQAYRLPMELRGLLCGGGDGGVACLTRPEWVDRVNAGIGALKDVGKIDAARLLLASAASWATAGQDALTADSLLAANPTTRFTLGRVRDYAAALSASLSSGPTAVPFIVPALRFDLGAVFAAPPDPAHIGAKPFIYPTDAGTWEWSEQFFDQAFPSSSDLTWRRDSWSQYQYTDPDAGTNGWDAIIHRLAGYELLLE